MSIPRDISGSKLAAMLGRYGYQVTRQTGSHMRLTATTDNRQHHITIPQHKSLKVGTLRSILGDVAQHLQMSVQDLQKELFD